MEKTYPGETDDDRAMSEYERKAAEIEEMR